MFQLFGAIILAVDLVVYCIFSQDHMLFEEGASISNQEI